MFNSLTYGVSHSSSQLVTLKCESRKIYFFLNLLISIVKLIQLICFADRELLLVATLVAWGYLSENYS